MGKVKQKTEGAVIYTRVSTEEQVNNSSLAGQERECRAKAASLGLEVIAVFSDPGVSGGDYLTRPGVQAAIGMIESGRANALICYDLDRLSREPRHYDAIKDRLVIVGGRLVFCTQQFDDTPEGGLSEGLTAQLKLYEKRVIRRRCMKGRRDKVAEGLQPSRSMWPYGYRIVTKQNVMDHLYDKEQLGKYVVVEEEAQWVRAIFGKYAEGQSLRSVCRFLTQDNNVKTPRNGDFWRPSTIKRILGNPVYKGEAPFARHERISQERMVNGEAKKLITNRIRPEDQWLKVECPALVSEDTWNTCQRRLVEGKELFGGSPTRKHILTGLLRCPTCRRGMVGQRRDRKLKGKVRHEHNYYCPDSRASRNTGGAVCNPKHHAAANAEGLVLEAITRVVREPDLVAAALRRYREELTEEYSDIDHMRLLSQMKQLDDLEAATVDAQIEAKVMGVSSERYKTKLQEIGTKRLSLQESLNGMGAAKAKSRTVNVNDETKKLREVLEAVERVLLSPDVTDAEKHNALARVVLEVLPEKDADGNEGYLLRLKPYLLGQGEEGPVVRTGNVVDKKSAGAVANVRMLWPPAAATSKARLTCSWPLTSQKSRSSPPCT